jgi:type III pantothenate kinase
MLLLFDIGNTNTHIGLANSRRVIRQINVRTEAWFDGTSPNDIVKLTAGRQVEGATLCSVVPSATPFVSQCVKRHWRLPCLELTPGTLQGVGIDYPKPSTIGPDRLANAVAARHRFGAPVVVVDFGTAVTFDVVDCAGNYVGGIIAPGLSAMTDYLHEKTALLPRVRMREIKCPIGKSTAQAMLVGAVHGYRGLVRALIVELKRELKVRALPVVATGGYARLIAARLPEITAVDQLLTLEGLRLVWEANQQAKVMQSVPLKPLKR